MLLRTLYLFAHSCAIIYIHPYRYLAQQPHHGRSSLFFFCDCYKSSPLTVSRAERMWGTHAAQCPACFARPVLPVTSIQSRRWCMQYACPPNAMPCQSDAQAGSHRMDWRGGRPAGRSGAAAGWSVCMYSVLRTCTTSPTSSGRRASTQYGVHINCTEYAALRTRPQVTGRGRLSAAASAGQWHAPSSDSASDKLFRRNAVRARPDGRATGVSKCRLVQWRLLTGPRKRQTRAPLPSHPP